MRKLNLHIATVCIVLARIYLKKMKKESHIILFIANRQGCFSREVLRGVMNELRDVSGWEVWLMPNIYEKRQLETCLAGQKVAGVIARGLDTELFEILDEKGIPVVLIRGAGASSKDVYDTIHVDDDEIGHIAGSEWVNLNLSYWGYVHWEGEAWSEARRQSLEEFAMSVGAQMKTLSMNPTERSSWDGVQKMTDWLQDIPKPCGILACNDEAAVDVLHACRLSEFDVPSQVAVIGVDNDRLLCESTMPPLSSIDLHAKTLGMMAARQLRIILGEDNLEGGEQQLGKATMVVRESSHAVDRYLLIYQKAMDSIREHKLTGISVSEMAEICGISRRGLERAFEKHVKRSPASVIREQRLEEVLRLLRSQSTSLDNLAQQTGFSDAAGLSNFVKRMTGKAPGEFR